MAPHRLMRLIVYAAAFITLYIVTVNVLLPELKQRYSTAIQLQRLSAICPAPQQANNTQINVEPVSIRNLERIFPLVDPGGVGRPKNCTAVSKVAIMVAFRDREQHLGIFLRHFHPFLQRQLLDYRVFIVQMTRKGYFNKGSLFNAGFLEIEKRFPGYFDCIVLQDVDVLPEDNRISYACNSQPTHMASYVDKWHYKIFYVGLIGGAFQINFADYRRVNGFSNQYVGWGGEDDDFKTRLDRVGIQINRYPEWSRWTTLKHRQARIVNYERTTNLTYTAADRMEDDGLNDINYRVITYTEEKLYTNITVEVNTAYENLEIT